MMWYPPKVWPSLSSALTSPALSRVPADATPREPSPRWPAFCGTQVSGTPVCYPGCSMRRGRPMHFQHSGEIWRDFPELVPGVLLAEGITPDVSADSFIAKFTALARSRLAEAPESEFPEIQAWRRTFARMGLKPTQYRCAAESLLRRLRKEGALPRLHPLVDLCNAVSLAFAIPV